MIAVSGGTYPDEVTWSLVCDGLADPITGGAPYTATHAVPPGTCTLSMYDSYGDGWNGYEWSAPGWTHQSFSLASGASGGRGNFLVEPSPPLPPSSPPLPPSWMALSPLTCYSC